MSLTGRGKLFQSLPPIIDNTFCPKVVRLNGITQSPIYSTTFGKSHAAEGGARLCNTLYTKQAYLRRLKLSKLKNVCLSKTSQWWNDNAFLSKAFLVIMVTGLMDNLVSQLCNLVLIIWILLCDLNRSAC